MSNAVNQTLEVKITREIIKQLFNANDTKDSLNVEHEWQFDRIQSMGSDGLLVFYFRRIEIPDWGEKAQQELRGEIRDAAEKKWEEERLKNKEYDEAEAQWREHKIKDDAIIHERMKDK